MLWATTSVQVIHGREARATRNENHADLDSTEWFGSNPNLDDLINMQGASQSPRSHDAGAIAATDSARLQNSATQNRPHFIARPMRVVESLSMFSLVFLYMLCRINMYVM